jgi:hypothetical protein
MNEIREQFKRSHDSELNALYRSANIVKILKSRGLRWAGNVAGK